MKHTEETRKKMSLSRVGKGTLRKGTTLPESHKLALRVPKKVPKEQTGKLNHMHGGKWSTDGVTNVFLKPKQQLPTGYRYGRTKWINK